MSIFTRYKKIEKYQRDKFPVEELLEKPAIDFRKKEYEPLLKDLQANILKHHHKPIGEHHFIRFETGENGVLFLDLIGQHITSALEQLEGRTSVVLSAYLTFQGYEKLGISDTLIPEGNAFRSAFNENVLLENGTLDKAYSDSFDAIILFAYDELPDIKQGSGKALGKFWNYMSDVHELPNLNRLCSSIVFEEGSLKNPMSEPYRFKENISNPKFFPGAFSMGKRKNMMQAIQSPKSGELAQLQLVLQRDKAGNQGFSCGSFGVFAKFEMHENAFDLLVEDLEVKAGLDKKQAMAYMMGRFPDGTPLTLSESPLNLPTNHFDYTELIKTKQVAAAQEDQGSRCPFHAHIRKANPRTPDSKDRRIVRRGSFYKNENAKGLLFMSFQSNLEEQFDYILHNWMLNKNTIQAGETEFFVAQSGRDMLFAKAGEEYALPGVWNGKASTEKLKIKEPLVSFKGGIYFFAPSISFFERIALFGEIAKAKKNHLAKINQSEVMQVQGQESHFRKETVILLGEKKIKSMGKHGVEYLKGSGVEVK